MKLSLPPQAIALLNTISGPESGGAYNVIYGGQTVNDLSDHPRVDVPITSGPNEGKTSSAAGKYQFLKGTWDEYKQKLGLPDFSPDSQDRAAWQLAQDAYKDATGGDLTKALSSNDPIQIAKVGKALAPIWTSLPGGIEQGTNSDKFVNAYASHLNGNGAADAANAMANGTLPEARKVQTVGYVPPPFSSEQGQFTPLLGGGEQQQPTATQQPVAAPAAPEAPSELVQPNDVMKAWGLDGPTAAPTQADQQAPAPQADPNDAIIKAWGLDKTDAAPAKSFVNDGTVGPTIARGGTSINAAQPDQAPSTLTDVVKSGGAGLARGTADLVGLPGTLNNLFNYGAGWLLRKGYEGVTGSSPAPGSFFDDSTIPSSPLSGEAMRGYLGKASSGATDYAAKTTPGKYAGNVGEFLPSAVALGGGNMLANGIKFGVIPGVASEAAGEATQGTKFEPWARAGAALLSPAALQGGVALAKNAGNALMTATPSGAAANNLTKALAGSGMTPEQISAEMARNPRLTPMDLDPNLQQMAMNLANQGGAPRATLNSVVENRMAGAKDAVQGAFNDALGTTPDVQAYLQNLKTTAQTNAKAGFGDALNNAKPVNVSPVIESIDSTIAPGVQASLSQGSNIPVGPVEQALAKVKAQLSNGDEMLTDPQRLHQIQSDLRVQADTLSKSASGQDKLVASALRDVRDKLVGQIDEAAGGKYRPAQKQYADDMSIQDAFDKGRQVLSNGTSSDAALQNRPEYWRSWMADAAPAEVDAAKVGARVAIDNQINAVRSAAAKGAAVPDVGFNRDRLEILLGKSEADKLAQSLADEQRIAQTNAKLFAGSQTAPRQAVNNLTAVTQVSPGIRLTTPIAGFGGFQVGGLPGAAAGVGLSLAGKGIQKGAQMRDLVRNRLMADAISGDAQQFQNAVTPANRFFTPSTGNLLTGQSAVPTALIGGAGSNQRPSKQQ
ncbi:hypothetical protein ACTJJ7_16240 [Phyllobacterium sp. 22229]|uniref:hypothetical protein n=1 Tax=Phyllobacterium sp. 22229 TaxID=3453895 RepID=UPI003F85D135